MACLANGLAKPRDEFQLYLRRRFCVLSRFSTCIPQRCIPYLSHCIWHLVVSIDKRCVLSPRSVGTCPVSPAASYCPPIAVPASTPGGRGRQPAGEARGMRGYLGRWSMTGHCRLGERRSQTELPRKNSAREFLPSESVFVLYSRFSARVSVDIILSLHMLQGD